MKRIAETEKNRDMTLQNPDREQEFDTTVFAVDFAKGFKKFWYIVVILAVISGTAAFYIKYTSYVPMYQSTVSFSVSSVSYSSNGSAVSASYYDNTSAAQMSKTFPYIVSTSMMRNAIQNELGTDYINGVITAEAVAPDSNIFKVSVSSSSPEDAFSIVQAVIKVYPDVARFVIGNINLNILIKPSLPEEPYTSNSVFGDVFIAVCAGIAAGCGIISVYALFRNTIRKKEDFKEKLNQKCLAEIPNVVIHRKSKDKNKKAQILLIKDNKHPLFKEAFRLLRKRITRNLDEKKSYIIAVTSAAANEGKTTVAVNLASAFAMAGYRTALVDCDIKRRPVNKYIENPESIKGYTDVMNENDLSAFKSENAKSIWKTARYKAEDHVDIYCTGNSKADFSSEKMQEFFRFLKGRYKYVFVNTAPGDSVSDAVSVCTLCDKIIPVVKQDSVSIEKIRRTLEYLSYTGADIIGFAFNGVNEGFTGYGGYYYGYGRYGYGKYGYGRYGYGRYGYGRYGYGRYGYGYGEKEYGYGFEDDGEKTGHKHSKHKHGDKGEPANTESIENIPDSEIPDNNAE